MDFRYKKIRIETEILKLRELLENEVKKSISEGCDGILLSAGLDTSILAYVAAKNTKIKTFTLKFGNAPDAEYAKRLCKILGIEHCVLDIDDEILTKNLRETIKILGVFDPMEIRNSVAIYTILKFAKKYTNSVMTGDGADELFFGYEFLIKMEKEERENYAKNMWKNMH
ncbi:MAG: asparagine synthase C-terminal domain-containing protein [Candidatus Altarchaeum sp.]|nr:asparagine synthase C-terminal domain-containing protein [Candidatus Altarchaeum sp.]